MNPATYVNPEYKLEAYLKNDLFEGIIGKLDYLNLYNNDVIDKENLVLIAIHEPGHLGHRRLGSRRSAFGPAGRRPAGDRNTGCDRRRVHPDRFRYGRDRFDRSVFLDPVLHHHDRTVPGRLR